MQTIEMVRLIADEGKELVKGDQRASCSELLLTQKQACGLSDQSFRFNVDTFANKADEWTEAAKEEKPQPSLTGLTAPLEGSLEQGGE